MTERSPSRLAYLALPLALAAIVVVLAGLSVQRKAASFQPVGLGATADGGSWRVTRVDDPAVGLEVGDRILLVNGAAVSSGSELRGQLLGRPQSELLVSRGAAPMPVTYSRPGLDIDFRYLFLALIGAVYLCIGLYTVLKHRQRQGLLFYFWCLASAGLYLVTPGGGFYDRTGQWLYLADEVARLAMPPLMLHLFLIFPEPLLRGRMQAKLAPFLYLPAAVLLALRLDLILPGFSPFFPSPTPGAIDTLNQLGRVHLGAFVVLSLLVLAHRLVSSRDWEERRQTQWIVLGVAGGYLPFLLLQVLPLALHWELPTLVETLAVLPLALVPLTFAYAILRYKLWDIDVIARDVVSYTLTLLLGGIGFSLINLAVDRGVPTEMGLARNFLSFAAGLAIAGVLVPARRGIGASLERLQYRGVFGDRRSLADLGQEILHERDLDSLCATLLDRLEEALELHRANLILLHRGKLLPVRPHAGLPSSLAVNFLGETVWGGDVTGLPGAELSSGRPSPTQQVFNAGYRYAFPLTVRDQQVGLLLTSYRGDQKPLNSDDIELVRQLLNQASLAVENAQLLDQLHTRLEEVVRLQEYNEGIIESSPAGIAVLGTEDRVESANLAFAALVGSERSAVIGRRATDLLPIELPRPEAGLVETSFAVGDSDLCHLQMSVAQLGPEAQHQRLLVVQDISERVAIENELKEKDRLAALGMLAAGVAHEVNTPITGISSYAQMLLEDTPEGDPRRRLLEKMERQTFRAANIVNNLLEFARNKQKGHHPVALIELISETVDLLEERLAEHRIDLCWQPPQEPATVVGNPTELQQVVTNLLVNAVDAMPDGGRIDLGLEIAEERITLKVVDDGPGIARDDLEKIFQPFYSTKLGKGGTGLGLSISYEIVRRHGGEMRVTSRPGEGSRFTVELPRESQP